MRFSPDNRYVAAGTPSGNVYLWEIATKRLVLGPTARISDNNEPNQGISTEETKMKNVKLGFVFKPPTVIGKLSSVLSVTQVFSKNPNAKFLNKAIFFARLFLSVYATFFPEYI